MTPTERREAIALMGFESQRAFARYLGDAGWDERSVRRWFENGHPAPPVVDEWMRRRLGDPPPRRPDGEAR